MAKAKKEKQRVRLYVPEAALKHIAKHFEQVAGPLQQRFALTPAAEFEKADVALAEKTAAALDGVMHSSDADCPYFACVMAGADLENDAEFYGALGVRRGEKTKVGGYENDVLSTTYGPQHTRDGDETTYEENSPTIGLLTTLEDDIVEDELDEYVTKEEQAKYAAAAKVLEGLETVIIGGVLCTDPVSKLTFTVAKTHSGAWAGVLACRIET